MGHYKALSMVEQIELQEEVRRLRQREAELAAYVERLRTVLRGDTGSPMWFDRVEDVLAKTPPQSLHDHRAKCCTESEQRARDMRIAEAVRDHIDHRLRSRGESWSILLSSIDLSSVLNDMGGNG